MQPAKINYKIYQGSTFEQTFRWESGTKVYKPIQMISKSAPCIITTESLPQLPIGWRFKVVGAGGMKEINSTGDQYYICTAINGNQITINAVNSLLYTTYTSGGVVEYNEPYSLASLNARMQIRETVDSNTVIHEANSDNQGIVVNSVDKYIKLSIPATVTQAFDFSTAVYSLELYNTTQVIPFLVGNLTLVREVTR